MIAWSIYPATPANEEWVLRTAGDRGPRRATAMRESIAQGDCSVAILSGRPIGFAMLEYSFFDQGFVSLLWVDENARRQGIGSDLMRAARARCDTKKLFTSTNLSNRRMQALLEKLGYRLAGVVHDLDEGDPELLYVID